MSKALHLSKSDVSRTLLLLELAPEVQLLIGDGSLSPTTAFELRKLAPEQQLAVAQAAIGEKLTAAETADRVAAVRGKPEKTPRIAHQRRVIKVAGGAVSVKLDSGETGDAEVLTALELAVTKVRRAVAQAA